MDPLSISVAVITLLGAADAIRKGLLKLKAFQKFPAEIAMLTNEISSFTLFLEVIRAHTSEAEKSNSQDIGLKLLADQIVFADNLLQEMNKMVEACLGNQEKFLRGGLRMQKKAREFGQRVRSLRENIHDSLTIYQGSSQRQTFSTVFLKLDEINTQVSAGALAVNALQDSQTRIEEAMGNLAAGISFRAVETATRASGVQPDNGATNSDRLTEGEGINSVIADTPSPSEGLPLSALLIRATVGRDCCPQWCPCQCHIPSRFGISNILYNLLGKLLLVFNNIAIPTTKRCDYHRCRKTKVASFNLSYYFPTWMLGRAFTLMGTWKDLSGAGVSLVVRMPRVRPEDAVFFRYIETGNIDAVRDLLSKGDASPFDVSPHGKTCLWRAAIFSGTNSQSLSNYLEMCRLFINEGANTEATDITGSTPTCGAFESMLSFSRYGDASEIKSIFPIDEWIDSKGPDFTLLHRIVTGQSPYIRLEDALRADGRYVVTVDEEGHSPLFFAAETGDTEAVTLLIQHGAEINRPDRWSITSLMAATWFNNSNCVAVMLEAGADVNYCNEYSETALFFSAQSGHTLCAELLLRAGANANVLVPYQLGSLLHTVAYYGHAEMVDLLINYGADVEARNDSSRTPLAAALFWSFGTTGTKLDQVARRLYRRGCKLDFANDFECRNHKTDACYCVQLIEELLAM